MILPHFCLLSEIGGNNKKVGIDRNDSIGKNCLIPKQTEYIYRKLKLGSLINKNTIKERNRSTYRIRQNG